MMVRESRHLWVGNLPEKIQEEDLIKYFERFGRVQSVKLLKDKDTGNATTSTATQLSANTSETGTSPAVAATVAFIDIKSASKAHAAQNSVDGRVLRTDYYDAHASSIHGENNGTNNNTSTVLKSSSLPTGNAVSAATVVSNDVDRSHGQTSVSTIKSKSRSDSSQDHEAVGSPSSEDQSEEESPSSRIGNPSASRASSVSRTKAQRTVSNNTGSTSQTSGSNGNSAPTTNMSSQDRERRSRIRPRTSTKETVNSNGPDDRDRHHGATLSTHTSKKKRVSAQDATSLSIHSSFNTSQPSLSETGSARSPRNSRESSTGSQENGSSASSSCGKPSVFETLSKDKRPLAICVRNLPSRSSDSSLKDGLFHEYKKYGKIIAVKVQGNGADRHGIICFKRPEDVEKACDMSKDKKFFGANVHVSARRDPVDLVDADYRLKDDEMDEYHPKATRTLYVGDLDKSVTAEDLKDTFGGFGEILDVDIKRQATGNSYAFIQFTDITSVVKALRKMEGCTLGGGRVKVGFGKSMPTTCIWCDNLPEKTSERALIAFFARAGPVRYCSTNRERAQGLVFFETVDFAQTAMTDLRSKPLQGRRLQLDYASRECQAAFFQEMERSGQMTMERKSNPFWETVSHVAASRFPEREAFPPFTDARAHLLSRQKHRHSRLPVTTADGRIRPFPAYGVDPPTTFEDSYERELWDYGYNQRERRSEKRSARGDSPVPSRENGHPHKDLSDVESEYSDLSEHSSNRRLFRILSPSPPSSVKSRGSRRRRFNANRRHRRRSKDYDRTRSASPSSPISPTLNEHSDTDASSSPAPRRRFLIDERDRTRRPHRSPSVDSFNSQESSPKSRRRKRFLSGPHTPESTDENAETHRDSPARAKKVIDESADGLKLVLEAISSKTKADGSDSDQAIFPVTSSVAEKVVADSNTPEVTSSKGAQKPKTPTPSRRSSTDASSQLLETGSDVVTSTVNHATSPTSCHDPIIPSSPDSESSKKSESIVPIRGSAPCGPVPEFYRLRIDRKGDFILECADLPLPDFAYTKLPVMLAKTTELDGKTSHDEEAPTPPASPKLRSSFHDRMKALDEKFEKISSVTVPISHMKSRSISVNETLDKPDTSPTRAMLTKRSSEYGLGSTLLIKIEPMKVEPDVFILPEKTKTESEEDLSVVLETLPKPASAAAEASLPVTATVPLSNIAKYTANPKFTVRSVSTSSSTTTTAEKSDTPEAKSPPAKPVTSDISAKILSITAEASAKFSRQQQQVATPAKSSVKTELEQKPSKQEVVQNLFFGSPVKNEDVTAKPAVDHAKVEISSPKKDAVKIDSEIAKADSVPKKPASIVRSESLGPKGVQKAVEKKPEPKSANSEKKVEPRKTFEKSTKITTDVSKQKPVAQKAAVKGAGLFFGEDPNAKMFRKNTPVLTPHAQKLFEKERAEKEKAEKERLEKERTEKERVEKERAEKERIEKERLEKERVEKERIEKERLEKERIQKALALAEKLEKDRMEKEKARLAEKAAKEAERAAKEAERVAKEKAEKERLEREQAEKAEKERIEREKAEKKRIEKENAEKERKRIEKENAEKERKRVEKENAEKEKKRLEKEAFEKERKRVEKENAEKERKRIEKENAERERLERERLEAEKAEKEQAALAAAGRAASKKSRQKIEDVPQDLSMKKKDREQQRSTGITNDFASLPQREPLELAIKKPEASKDLQKASDKAYKKQKYDKVEEVSKATEKPDQKPLRGLASLAKQTPKDAANLPAEESQKTQKPPMSSVKIEVEVVAAEVKPVIKRPRKVSMFGGEDPADSVESVVEESAPVVQKSGRRPGRPPKEGKFARKRLSRLSRSSSDSKSSSPVRQPVVARKKSEVSGSEKSEALSIAPAKRGRKKKVVESSAESDSSDDDLPKKNIFEVSLRPEDLQCSMYDKIKRRACTKVVLPPTTPAGPSSVADRFSRQSVLSSRDSLRKDSPAPPKKLTVTKRVRDPSSSSGSSGSGDVKDRKSSSSASSSSNADSDYSGKTKRVVKRKSPVQKKPVAKPVVKTRQLASETDTDTDSLSESEFSNFSDSEPKKQQKKSKKIEKKVRKVVRKNRSTTGTETSASDDLSDSSVEERKSPVRSKKVQSVKKKEPSPTPEPPPVKKMKVPKPSVAPQPSQNPPKMRTASPPVIPRPPSPLPQPAEDKKLKKSPKEKLPPQVEKPIESEPVPVPEKVTKKSKPVEETKAPTEGDGEISEKEKVRGIINRIEKEKLKEASKSPEKVKEMKSPEKMREPEKGKESRPPEKPKEKNKEAMPPAEKLKAPELVVIPVNEKAKDAPKPPDNEKSREKEKPVEKAECEKRPKSPEKEKTKERTTSTEKEKLSEKGKVASEDREDGGFDGGTYNLSMLMKNTFMETASRESSVASPAAALTPKPLSTMKKHDQKHKSKHRGHDKTHPPVADVRSPNNRDFQPSNRGPVARTTEPISGEITKAGATINNAAAFNHVKSPKAVEPVAWGKATPTSAGKPDNGILSESGPKTVQEVVQEQPAAPVAASTKDIVPPVVRQLVEVVSAPVEVQPEHNLEEEMEAAEMLQQLMDNEPSRDEPVIHIPDRDDAYGDELNLQDAEIAASIAGIAGLDHVEIPPAEAPVSEPPKVAAEPPKEEVERKREAPSHTHLYEPVPQPEFRSTVQPVLSDHNATPKADQDKQQKKHGEKQVVANPSADPPAPKPMQTVPLASVPQMQTAVQQQSPVGQGVHRTASQAMMPDENEAKRAKKGREEEPRLPSAGHNAVVGQNVHMVPQAPQTAVQQNPQTAQRGQQPQNQAQKFEQMKMEEHLLQMQRQQQELNQALFFHPQLGFNAGNISQSPSFRTQGASGFPAGMHIPNRDELGNMHLPHPAHVENVPTPTMSTVAAETNQKKKKRKGNSGEEVHSTPNPQAHPQPAPHLPLIDQQNPRLMMQMHQQQGANFPAQAQQFLMRFPGQGLPQNFQQLQQQHQMQQQQQQQQHQLQQHMQQQQQQSQGKQPNFGPASAQMRPPSVIPSSNQPQPLQLNQTNEPHRQNTVSSGHQQSANRSLSQTAANKNEVPLTAVQSPVGNQQKAFPQMPSPSIPQSPQGMQPSPQMSHQQQQEATANVGRPQQLNQKGAHYQQQQQQQQQQQRMQQQNALQQQQTASSSSVPVIMSNVGRPGQGMHPVQNLQGATAGNLVISSANGAPMFIPLPQHQQQQQQNTPHPPVQKEVHQVRSSAVLSSQAPSHGTTQGAPQNTSASHHAGRSSTQPGSHLSSQQQQQQPMPNLSPMPIDAAHLALLQNLTANSGAIAKLLQHPHQQNVAEHQKELQQQQQQHQQQQQQQQQQSQHHIGRPEPISLQQQMEKNRAQQEASARQNPASLLRPGSAMSFSPASGLMSGVEVPSAFLTPQFVYGPYGFGAAEMGQQGGMDGRIPLGVAGFRAPFMPQGLSEANLQQAMQAAHEQAEIRAHQPGGSQEKLDQLQHLQRMDAAAAHPQMGQWSAMQAGSMAGDIARMQAAQGQPLSTNMFPTVWQGTLALKNDHAFVRMHFVGGNQELARVSLPGGVDVSQNILKISQRMRLEAAQLESVSRRMQEAQEHCILLACASGKTQTERLQQAEMLITGFMTYLQQKQAAGIVNISPNGPTSQPQYVIHIFPPCDFSKRSLIHFGPSISQMIDQTPHLFVVITTS